jgi:glycosyltransferase 2 family protein
MKLVLKALVSLGVLAALFLLLPWAELRQAAVRLSPWVGAGALAGFLLGHRLGVVKWRLLVNAGRPILSGQDALRCYAAGLFANLCLPGIVGGDVLRATLAARTTRRPETVVLGSLADRAIDVLAVLCLLALGAALARGTAPGWMRAVIAALALSAAGGALVLALLLRRPLARWPARLRRPLGRGRVALRRLGRRPGTALAAFAIALSVQAGFLLLGAWIGRSIGIDVPLAAWLLAWPLAKLVGLVPVSLGGLGVRDATLAGLLAAWGAPVAQGAVASLAWQGVLVAGGLLAGGLWLLLGREAGPHRVAEARAGFAAPDG